MCRKIYQTRSILFLILLSLIFTLNIFGQDISTSGRTSTTQNNRQRAIALKKEGDALFDRKDYRGAIQKYMQAIDADDTYPETFWSLGMALSNVHEHKLAGQSIKLYLDRVSDIQAAFVWFQIGNQYRLAKEFSLSSNAFDTALRQTPAGILDLDALADIYSYRGNLQKAVEYQIRAINYSNSDDDSGRYIGLSWYYSFLGQHQNAVNAATKAIQIDSDEPMAYTNRCRAYNDLKQYQKAIADCSQALRLRPDHGETQYYLANSYRALGRRAEATRLNREAIPNLTAELKQAAELEVISIHDYCYILGNALYEDGQYETAIKAYEVGREFRSNFPLLIFNLGMTYLKVGNKTAALEQYRELAAIDTAKANILKQRINAAR
jgi:tetratricopeptide (TPR) repeat protein